MAELVRLAVPIARVAALYPGVAAVLPDINQALRNINFGQMDQLPYEATIEGYHLFIRAELEPMGTGRPPQIGHWQLEIARDGADHRLYLQGKASGSEELCEIVFVCGPTAESETLRS